MKANFPVLVVEDDPISRKILERLLTKVGHEITGVENGLQALEASTEVRLAKGRLQLLAGGSVLAEFAEE